MNAPERLPMPDIQSMTDHRAIAIDRVGIRGLRHPINVAAAGDGQGHTHVALS
jgi:GTP cyclohydrolase FolE2